MLLSPRDWVMYGASLVDFATAGPIQSKVMVLQNVTDLVRASYPLWETCDCSRGPRSRSLGSGGSARRGSYGETCCCSRGPRGHS